MVTGDQNMDEEKDPYLLLEEQIHHHGLVLREVRHEPKQR